MRIDAPEQLITWHLLLYILHVLILTYIRDKGPLYRCGLMPKEYFSWETITWMAAAVV